jgi:predicted nucleotidyltransferase
MRRGGHLDAIRAIGDHEGMVKLDERAVVPKVDAAARERLAKAFDREGVVAAMLIGSQARGNPGPLSDIDIAYWHEPGLDRDARWQLRLDLIGTAEETLRTSEVDLVPLNEAPPLMQQRSIRDAVRLVERDRDERVRLETRAILDYLDTQPLRDALGQRLKRLFEERSFWSTLTAPKPGSNGCATFSLDYADVFRKLAEADLLPSDLAVRLSEAGRCRAA